jgi:spore germination cell wall hydrolase CwlJ-like protein
MKLYKIVITGLCVLFLGSIPSQASFPPALDESKIILPPTTQSAIVKAVYRPYLEKELQCLAQSVYYEAGSESMKGKIAVAQIALNRTKDVRFPKSICGVINQRTNIHSKVYCQYSYQCSKKIKKINRREFDSSMQAAKMVLIEGVRLPEITHALYFHATSVRVRHKKSTVSHIGNHVFYR